MSDPIRYELEQANKTELAEMYRSVFRPTIRPSLLEVLNGYTKDQISSTGCWPFRNARATSMPDSSPGLPPVGELVQIVRRVRRR